MRTDTDTDTDTDTGDGDSFGKFLRRRRLALGWTQEDLAERSGLSVRAISDLERGRTIRPRRSSAESLTRALEVPLPQQEPMPEDTAGGLSALPRQLPSAVPHFAGRSAELAALSGMLDHATWASGGTVRIAVLTGTAGVGKSALAVHWAHHVADRFPDGQLHVNLRGFGPAGVPVPAAEAIRLFLDGLGIPAGQIPAGLDAQAALYRSLLADRRMLIVLDNARDPAQIRPLLPAAPGCLVLVTSRNQFIGLAASDGAHLLTLDVLTEGEARDLLAGRLGSGRIAAEPAAVAELTSMCAGLPLALSIAAARAAARPALPLAAFAAELRDTQARLDALGTGDEATDARTVFSWSYRQLSEPAGQMFRLIGLHPGPDITVPAAASLAGVPLARAHQSLRALSSAHLITEHAPGRYAAHDLLRAYAAEQGREQDSGEDRRSATHRVLDHYLHTASAASLLLHPYRDPLALDPPSAGVRLADLADRQQALAWFQAERQVLLAAISQAAGAGFTAHACRLPYVTAIFFDWRGYWQDLVLTQEAALAAARQIGDRTAQAQAHRYLGRAQIRLGGYAGARKHLTEALTLGSSDVQARVHIDLTEVCDLQGRGHDALSHAEQALRLFRAAGQARGEANALNEVGWCLVQLGRYQEALDYCAQAIKSHRHLGDKRGEAASLDSLGYAYYHLGDYAEAMVWYQQAIDVDGDDGDLRDRAEHLTHLGDAHQMTGDRSAARRAWQEALDILDGLLDPGAGLVREKLSPSRT